jgi:hypothetical protein
MAASIIWIDSAPLIKAEHKKYLAAIKRLTEAKDRLELHTKSDEPKYTHWLHVEFADQLENIRKLHHRYFELENIITVVEEYVRETGGTPFEGYEAYLEAKQMQELVEKLQQEARERKEERTGKKQNSEEEADDSESSYESHRSHDSEYEAPTQRKSAKKASDESAIKQIYRQLARRLHPDINGNLSAHERELWFEVQQAYDDRDLARLEALLAMAEREAEEGDEARVEKIQSLGRLKSMLKNLGRKLRSTQKSLAKAKKSLAWDFHKIKQDPRKMSKLRFDISIEFQQMEQGMDSDIRRFEKQISRWERGLNRRRERDSDQTTGGRDRHHERGHRREEGNRYW